MNPSIVSIKGKQKNDEMKVRLVAVYNEDEEKYHIYRTNIQKDVLNKRLCKTVWIKMGHRAAI
jgi:hypothetical protein